MDNFKKLILALETKKVDYNKTLETNEEYKNNILEDLEFRRSKVFDIKNLENSLNEELYILNNYQEFIKKLVKRNIKRIKRKERKHFFIATAIFAGLSLIPFSVTLNYALSLKYFLAIFSLFSLICSLLIAGSIAKQCLKVIHFKNRTSESEIKKSLEQLGLAKNRLYDEIDIFEDQLSDILRIEEDLKHSIAEINAIIDKISSVREDTLNSTTLTQKLNAEYESILKRGRPN